jgi:hypothetical protein
MSESPIAMCHAFYQTPLGRAVVPSLRRIMTITGFTGPSVLGLGYTVPWLAADGLCPYEFGEDSDDPFLPLPTDSTPKMLMIHASR